MTVTSQNVRFHTEDGIALAGVLNAPDNATAVVAFTGPFTGVKEQVVGTYAAKLAEAGFATLAFDHRNFGESGGTVRQHEDPGGKLADLRAAVAHLRGLGFDRLGLTGVCLGASYALKAAAQDPRVQAVACVAGGFLGAPSQFAGRGEAYRDLLRDFVERGWTQTGELVFQNAVSDNGEPATMPGTEPFEYYGTSRSYSPHWQNRISIASSYQMMTLDSLAAADLIAPTPLLIVHGTTDNFCPPADAKAVYERAKDPKKIVWLPTTNHIDLYDVPEYVEPAVTELVDFFRSQL